MRPLEWGSCTEAELAMLALVTDVDRQGWQWRVACAGADPELFFSPKGGTTAPAKRICGSCGVRTECLNEALADNIESGVWGGLSPQERRKLKPPTRWAASVRRSAEIRRLAAQGWELRQIAERFGMTTAAVRNLVRRTPSSRRGTP
jgi:hypothetical protein